MIRIAAELLLGLVPSGGAAQGSRLPLFDARAAAAVPSVVPFIRPYRNLADRGTWFIDPELPPDAATAIAHRNVERLFGNGR